MIELAAAVWDIPLSAAIVRLVHEGLPMPEHSHTEEAVSAYTDTDLARRYKVDDLWKRSQQFLANNRSSQVNDLRKKLGLIHNFSQDRFNAGPGKLYGALGSKTIAETFHVRPSKSGSRIFTGLGWGDVLVIPYYNAPRRIAALQFIGRNGSDRDTVIRPAVAMPGNVNLQLREAGLAGLDLALEHTGRYVIAVSNPFVFLKLHMRNFNTSLRALPLVAWHASRVCRTRNAWEALSEKQIILWDWQLTPDLLIQCHRSDGQLSLCGPKTGSRQAMRHYLRDSQPGDLVKKIVSSALPWREAVAGWLRATPEPQILSLVHKLGEMDEDAVEILRECDRKHPLWDKPALPMPKRVRVEDKVYVERAGRWLVVDKQWERRVIDAALRISHVIYRGKHCEYIGELKIGGDEIPFRLLQKSKAPISFAHQLIEVAARHGHRLIMERQADLAKVAMALHEPKIIKGRSHVGWMDGGFRFKHFSICNGQVHPHPEYLFPLDCPGPHDREYRLGRTVLRRMGLLGVEAEVSWAIVTALATAVLAAPAAQEGHPVLLVGEDSVSQFQAVLARCGVGKANIHKAGDMNSSVWVPKWPHQWPILVGREPNVRTPDIPRWLLASSFPGVFNCLDAVPAYTLLNHGGFMAVHCGDTLRPAAMSKFPVEHALMCYLRYATGHMFRERDSKDFPFWNRVHADMLRWLESESVDTTALENCRRWVRLQDDPDLIVRLAVALYRCGYLRPEGANLWKRSISVPCDSRGLVLTKDHLLRALHAARMTPPNLEMHSEPIIVSHAAIKG